MPVSPGQRKARCTAECPPRVRRVLPREDAEDAGPTQGAHGEGQQPDPAAVPIQVGEERMRAMEAEMANIRRTLNRHSYRLGFVQRGMVRLRNMVQRRDGGSKRLGEVGPICGGGVAGGCVGIARQLLSTVWTAGAKDPVEGVPAYGGSVCRGCVAVALQLVANGEQVPVELTVCLGSRIPVNCLPGV
ncbi:UNVERIFIED_CONTAM: hypothetical protein K2H54_057468 [Gekko kuhli]